MSEPKALRTGKYALAAVLLLAALPVLADDLEGLVDPTAPLNMSVALSGVDSTDLGSMLLPQFERYELNSVLIRENDRIAVVNGQRLRVGEGIGTARVTRIDQNGVILEINGEPRVLALYGAPVKTLVAAGEEQ